MSTVTEPLLTAEEYMRMPDPGYPTELVKGKVVRMPPPMLRHGQICVKVSRLLGNYAEDHQLGHVVGNDSGVITERDPDTVRGADVSFYSYTKIPPGPLPDSYSSVVPDLVFEILSPSDRWTKVSEKVGEYIRAGVQVVCVLDAKNEILHVHEGDEYPRPLHGDDEFALPGILGEFRVPVRRFFE